MTKLTDLGNVHVIGCGGVGMAPLAEVLLRSGRTVSGSEQRESPALTRLRDLGASVTLSPGESTVDGADTVVYSTATPNDHPELVAANRRGLRVLHRSAALAYATQDRGVVAVAGTHGKTTTTAMTTSILRGCGQQPGFYVGGDIAGLGMGGYGGGDEFVLEADESDRTFLNYTPHVAVVTNIDSDHLDTYGSLSGVEAAFREFCERIKPDGFLVTNADDRRCRELAATVRAAGGTVYTYGTVPDADLRVSGLSPTGTGSEYVAHLDGVALGVVDLPVPGRHMALNSAAALLTALRLLPRQSATQALESLARFPGVRRRFEHKGTAGNVRVYDDYACHHTSMAASLTTMRELAGDSRLLVLCQPVRTYRVRDFRTEMAAALGIADEAVVLEVHSPGEPHDPTADGATLTEAIPLPQRNKHFAARTADAVAEITRRARPGDVVVTIGSPAVAHLAEQLVTTLDVAGEHYEAAR